MPDFRQRIGELEQHLADLKAQHAAGHISTDAYVDQAGRLRFTDGADGRTWWLDPNSGLWYVEAAGAPGFDLAAAELSRRAASPPPVQSETEAPSPPAPEPAASPPPVQPAPAAQTQASAAEAPPAGGGVRAFFAGRRLRFLIPLEIAACCMAGAAGLYLLYPPPPQSISKPATPSAQPPLGRAQPPLGEAQPLPSLALAPTAAPAGTQPPFGETQPPLASPTPAPAPTRFAGAGALPVDTPSPSPTPTQAATPTPTLTPSAQPPSGRAAAPSPSPSPPFAGKLAYPFYVDAAHNFAVEVIDLASRQVVFTRPQASQPALTSDGQRLAYRSWNSSHLGLFEVMLTGQNERYLSVHEEAQRPQWGPDNRAVAFSFLKTEAGHEIKTINFDDEGLPLVPPTPGGFAQTAAWTPDGRLVFHACRMNACGLATALANGADFAFLTDSPEDMSPAVSPDGQQIAYTSRQGDNWDVYLVGIRGGPPTRLTTQPGKDGIPVWSPDGAWIAYASEVDGQWSIWAMAPDGRAQQPLVPLPGSLEGKVEAFVDDVQRGWRLESISWVR